MKKKDIKILLVDDEPISLKLWDIICLQEGYQIVTAVNGKEAVAKAKKKYRTLLSLM
jgi:two-component system alkaline phosphatase synthesis response regulator PhoP